MVRKRNSIVEELFLITVQICHGKNTLHVRGQLVRTKLGLFNDFVYLVHPTAGLQSKTWSSTKYNSSKTWSTSSLLTSDLEKQDKHLSVSSYWTCVKKVYLLITSYHVTINFWKLWPSLLLELVAFEIHLFWDTLRLKGCYRYIQGTKEFTKNWYNCALFYKT